MTAKEKDIAALRRSTSKTMQYLVLGTLGLITLLCVGAAIWNLILCVKFAKLDGMTFFDVVNKWIGGDLHATYYYWKAVERLSSAILNFAVALFAISMGIFTIMLIRKYKRLLGYLKPDECSSR